MMHHFGLGTPIDLDMAQIYYDKAMKEDSTSSTYMTPVYLLSLYSKWQKVDIMDSLSRFFLFGSSKNSSLLLADQSSLGLHVGGGSSLSDFIPRNQTLIGIAIVAYWLAVAGMVRFLRRD
jgi:TPR repeat protein